MPTWGWIVVAVLVVAVVALLVWLLMNRRKRQLKKQFGHEYERTVSRLDTRAAAHDELERRIERHDRFELRTLSDQERATYVAAWRKLQRVFTKQPATGLIEADDVVTALLADVGYPTDGFEQQAADLSVAHGDVIDDYRQAHAIVRDVRNGRAGTEEIRVALLRYRALFERVAGASLHDDEAVS